MQDNLIFLISTPRAGSTLLMRILHATSQIYSRPEPHILPALAHLGYWRTVDRAPYDQLQAQQAMQDFVSSQPKGENFTEPVVRIQTNICCNVRRRRGKYFLDKTPAMHYCLSREIISECKIYRTYAILGLFLPLTQFLRDQDAPPDSINPIKIYPCYGSIFA